MMGLVAAGMGISILPESLKRLPLDGLKFVPLRDPRAETAVWLAKRWDDRSSLVRHLFQQASRLKSKDVAPGTGAAPQTGATKRTRRARRRVSRARDPSRKPSSDEGRRSLRPTGRIRAELRRCAPQAAPRIGGTGLAIPKANRHSRHFELAQQRINRSAHRVSLLQMVELDDLIQVEHRRNRNAVPFQPLQAILARADRGQPSFQDLLEQVVVVTPELALANRESLSSSGISKA